MAVVEITAVAWQVDKATGLTRAVEPYKDEKGQQIEFKTTVDANGWPSVDAFGLVTHALYKKLMEARIYEQANFATFEEVQMRVSVRVREDKPREKMKVY